MNILIFLAFFVALVQGSPLKPPPPGTVTDKLESFPWIKAPKAKARFGTTPSPRGGELTTVSSQQPQPIVSPGNLPFVLTNNMLKEYLAAITTSLQPYVVPDTPEVVNSPVASQSQPSKGKVPKAINPADTPPTTDSYWDAERKMYPDSFYDEFYLDWLRKRQVEDAPGFVTPNPTDADESTEPTEVTEPPQKVQPALPQQAFPTVPLTFNPYMVNPFVYPLAGVKVSKAMAQAQVNAALAALNITTTPKPVKIKLKIPIPAGSDLAQVVSSGIAGFPAGTTYELQKK